MQALKYAFLQNYFRENILSISTSFKNNIPFGETNILCMNGSKISIQLNEFGLYCGVQNYYNEENELIKIKQLTLDANLEWVKKNDFYFILLNNSGLTNILSTISKYYSFKVQTFLSLTFHGLTHHYSLINKSTKTRFKLSKYEYYLIEKT